VRGDVGKDDVGGGVGNENAHGDFIGRSFADGFEGGKELRDAAEMVIAEAEDVVSNAHGWLPRIRGG